MQVESFGVVRHELAKLKPLSKCLMRKVTALNLINNPHARREIEK
jgi:hypothetical protein